MSFVSCQRGPAGYGRGGHRNVAPKGQRDPDGGHGWEGQHGGLPAPGDPFLPPLGIASGQGEASPVLSWCWRARGARAEVEPPGWGLHRGWLFVCSCAGAGAAGSRNWAVPRRGWLGLAPASGLQSAWGTGWPGTWHSPGVAQRGHGPAELTRRLPTGTGKGPGEGQGQVWGEAGSAGGFGTQVRALPSARRGTSICWVWMYGWERGHSQIGAGLAGRTQQAGARGRGQAEDSPFLLPPGGVNPGCGQQMKPGRPSSLRAAEAAALP